MVAESQRADRDGRLAAATPARLQGKQEHGDRRDGGKLRSARRSEASGDRQGREAGAGSRSRATGASMKAEPVQPATIATTRLAVT